MQIKEELGKNIQKYRKLNGITQEKLAELVDLEINSISSIERGKYFPTPDNLAKISKVLNVSLSDLFLFKKELSCDDYIHEITKNLEFLSSDKLKLSIVNSFIKTIL